MHFKMLYDSQFSVIQSNFLEVHPKFGKVLLYWELFIKTKDPINYLTTTKSDWLRVAILS